MHPIENKIDINNFQGVSNKDVIEAFTNIGKKFNDKPNVTIFVEANGESKYRGVVYYKNPQTCMYAKKHPPVFNGIPVTIIYKQTNEPISEISNKDNFTNLYLIGKYDDEDIPENSINFDSNILREKLKSVDVEDNNNLKEIVFLNQPFSGTFERKYQAILKYEDHKNAQNALQKITENSSDMQILKCCPAFGWG